MYSIHAAWKIETRIPIFDGLLCSSEASGTCDPVEWNVRKPELLLAWIVGLLKY